MKWNKHVKLTATATSALLFALLLASCSNDNNNNNVNQPVNNQIQQEQAQDSDETNSEDVAQSDGQTDDVKSNEEQSTEAQPTETKKPVVQDTNTYEATGKYLGAIDNNSIEVDINGVPTVFILTDAFDYVISDFTENSKVTIKYTKDSDGSYVQNVVTAISNAK